MLRSIALALLLVQTTASWATDSVTFEHRAVTQGDAVEQSVQVEMRLESTARQGAKVIETDSSSQTSTQTRRVIATQVAGTRVVGADVQFLDAKTVRDGKANAEPVAGKSYHCRRDGEQLTITTSDGGLPPMEEYEIVARAMETLGTVSPLAKFLAGRTVRVGEQLELPAELAQQALGFNDKIGEADRFALTLTKIETMDGRRVASFEAEIEAHGAGSQQMRLIVEGRFRVEEATCRIVSADLSGPLAMSGLRGPGPMSGYTLDAKGKMQMQLAARYRDAQR